MIDRRGFLALGAGASAVALTGCGGDDEMRDYTETAARLRATLKDAPALAEFVRYATLAPNGHNTQPWKFLVAQDRIRIVPDFARRTPSVDPDDHHLYVSLGCAAENLAIAARRHARAGETRFDASGDGALEIALAARAAISSSAGGDASPPIAAGERALFDAIPLRQSTRSVYDGRKTSRADLDALTAAARVEGVSLILLTAKDAMAQALDFVIRGNSAQMDDPAFVQELKDWIRFDAATAMDRRDGLFAACSGNPVLPPWLGSRIFSWVFKKDAENKKNAEQLRSSAGIAVFVGERADPEHWTRVGRSFERFALQATALGLRHAHLNQPTEVPGLREEFARWLGIGDARPDLVIRFGYAPPMPMTLRRPAKDVMFPLEG